MKYSIYIYINRLLIKDTDGNIHEEFTDVELAKQALIKYNQSN